MNNLLHVNEFDGITYFNKENFEELLRWLFLFNTLALKADTDENDEKKFLQEIKKLSGVVYKLINTAEESGYDLNKLKGKIIRIAHLGYMDDFDIVVVISALEKGLKKMGFSFDPGSGVKAAQKIIC